MNSNFSNLLDLRNLQEQVKKVFCYQTLFWPFTVWINCSKDLKFFCKFSAFSLEFQKFFSIEQFFLTVGQNNFGNKIPFLYLVQVFLDETLLFQNNFSHALKPPLYMQTFLQVFKFWYDPILQNKWSIFTAIIELLSLRNIWKIIVCIEICNWSNFLNSLGKFWFNVHWPQKVVKLN